MKEIVKAIYDISEANKVDINVAAAMLEENFRLGEDKNKGACIDYTDTPNVLGEAVLFAKRNYDAIVKSRHPEMYAEDEDKLTFEQLFEAGSGDVDGD